MKSYDEQTDRIRAKLSAKRRQRRRIITSTVSMICCLVLIVGVFLITPPTDTTSPASPTTPAPIVKPLGQDYSSLLKVLDSMELGNTYGDLPETDVALPEGVPDTGNDKPNTEITDNQVAGVTEADIIKRSDKYIFYMNSQSVRVYSIAGADSQLIGTYPLSEDIRWKEMYLSTDFSTLTLLGTYYSDTCNNVKILNLNVTNPRNIEEIGQMNLTGGYKSSRFTDGYLYLFTRYTISHNYNPDVPETFLPGYGTTDNMTELLMDDIAICDNVQYPVYTVISRLDPVTLEMSDTLALLGYNGEMYVSEQNIYLTQPLTESMQVENEKFYRRTSEIARIRFTGEQLELTGVMKVEGTIGNQYAMDEKDGILRVVTTEEGFTLREDTFGGYQTAVIDNQYTNASLFCIDFDRNKIIASVERFAPKGEDVRSVRFDGDKVYVCTSIMLQDPVFCFDLTDLSNITWKDTGTIAGFSTSLVDMGNGFLLGIGVGDDLDTVKIEVYREGQTSMEPYCSYEIPDAYISSSYKAYYIDRENQFVGMGVQLYNETTDVSYLLLHFDGTQLVPKVSHPMQGWPDTMRGFYLDGWLYMVGESFAVTPVQ